MSYPATDLEALIPPCPEPPPKCKHERRKPAYRFQKNGSRHYGMQCLDCGNFEVMKKAEIEAIQPLSTVPGIDQDLADAYLEQERNQYQEISDWHRDLFFNKYNAYLQTDRWAIKRAAVLKRDPICKACEVAPSEQAHHLTYEHVGDEPLYELIGVCCRCHEKIHNHDKTKCFCRVCEQEREQERQQKKS